LRLQELGLSPDSVATIATVQAKEHEPAIIRLAARLGAKLEIFSADKLNTIDVPNPSAKVMAELGCPGVAEAAAMAGAGCTKLLAEKTKMHGPAPADKATMAAAVLKDYTAEGIVDIVGAGPGAADLISVRGKRLLEAADLVLYAGSLVPKELTAYAKPGAAVISSADMCLQEQISCMRPYYDQGKRIVRLHTGDPCLYGAIQEQMDEMDKLGMRYEITPGISAFQAAASRLKSQFTIPGGTQTIILTRGQGRTPVPEREKISSLAQSQSTMCIYLSATLVRQLQAQLLEHYPPRTPVAVCHKLTWPGEKIWKGELCNLADIVEGNNLTLTTLLIIGDSISASGNCSKLYDKDFKHGARPQ
jgi:precorrin-4 C11-methyltransferase